MRGLFSLLFGVSALIFLSEARLARYKQGPLEWIWRSLIYGSMQPNRKANG
jgi:uncharacterized membrane protein YeiB